MARITIHSRLKAAPELAALLEVHGAALASGFEGRLARLGVPDGEGSDLAGVLERLRQGVLAARQDLAQRHEVVGEHRHASRRARERRDRAAARLRRLLVVLRGLVAAASFDPEAVEKILRLAEKTSRDPVVLLTQARRAMDGFEKAVASREVHGRQWLEGTYLDAEDWLAAIDAEMVELEEALTAAAFTRAQENGALVARRRAAKDFDDLFGPASRWVAELSSLAGAPSSTFRVSPNAHRSRRRRSAATSTSTSASFSPFQPRLVSSNEA